MHGLGNILRIAFVIAGILIPSTASALTFSVLATQVVGITPGLDTGINFNLGDSLTVTADPNDFWVLGPPPNREINADGNSSATGSPEFGPLNTLGQSFFFGVLVGQIGAGDFFLIGTNFNGTANAAGVLKLFNWDSNNYDNSGSIAADVNGLSVVPLPAALPLYGTGLAIIGFIGWHRKRKAVTVT